MLTTTTGIDVAAFDTNGRSRRPPPDPVNALLSFVYALLVKDLTVTLTLVGLDPFIGVYHHPRYGRPALALDLVEEFRPFLRPGGGSSTARERARRCARLREHGRSLRRLPRARLAPRCWGWSAWPPVLGLVFCVVWPLAGSPGGRSRWCSRFGVVLRILGFGYLLAGRRGPVLLVALLVVTTLSAWTPWARSPPWAPGSRSWAGSGLPRRQLLAVGVVLFLGGAGWVADTVSTARQKADSWAQTSDYNRAPLLPRSRRAVLDGLHPAPGSISPGRLQLRRVLDQGYQITDYRPC